MQPILIQGYQGSFHHLAAQRWSGKKVQIQACASFRELVHQLENQKQFKYGIMAIENSIAGSILPNYGLLEKSKLQIVGEIYFPIKQNLLALPGQTMKDIQEIHSHPGQSTTLRAVDSLTPAVRRQMLDLPTRRVSILFSALLHGSLMEITKEGRGSFTAAELDD